MDNPLISQLSLHQSEAEKLFAGAVMVDDEYARETCAWLSPAMLREEKIRKFWELVLSGTAAHEAAMEVQSYFEFLGYVSRVPTSQNVPIYANTIGIDFHLKNSAVVLTDMARAISDRDTDKLRALAQSIADSTPVINDAVPTAVEVGLEFQAMLNTDLAARSELTGIANLDGATGGLEKQTLTLIAARPSMGKSALGIQIAQWKATCEKDKRVMLFSLEMNRKSIFARMACGRLRVSWRDVRSGRAEYEFPGTIENLGKEASRLIDEMEDRLLIDDTGNMSMEDIWRKVSRYRPDLVIIDHMGLVSSAEQNEVLALGQISRMGKVMAKQFDIPVIMLYQLNRGTESRDNKRPTMKDIRGSGKIEENADNIFFLYRADYYDDAKPENQKTSETEINIAKFRDGIRNIRVELVYHLDEQRFESKREYEGSQQSNGRAKSSAFPGVKLSDNGAEDEPM
jgi:replicative DNA helicase